MTRSNTGQPRKCGSVSCILSQVGGHSGDQIPLVDGVEDLEHPGYFKSAKLGRWIGRHPQRHFVEAELGAGELAIISSRVISRLAVERPRILFTPQRFR